MNKKKIITVAAVILIVTAAIVLIVLRSGTYLVLTDEDSGKEYARFCLEEGEQFSIEFIHSVNKSPVKDVYEIIDQKIYVVETVYYGFGAGVQTELNEGEKLTYGDNGEMIISNINAERSALIYVVGTVSDHTLEIQNQKISLRSLCGKNAHVCFQYKFCLL